MLSSVLDAIPVRVFWKDKQSQFMGANRLFLEDAGLTDIEQLVGKSDFDMPWAEDFADKFRQDDATVIASGEAKLQLEELLLDAEGNEVWVSTNKAPLTNDKEEIIGVLGTYEDISKAKQAARELLEQRAGRTGQCCQERISRHTSESSGRAQQRQRRIITEPVK